MSSPWSYDQFVDIRFKRLVIFRHADLIVSVSSFYKEASLKSADAFGGQKIGRASCRERV